MRSAGRPRRSCSPAPLAPSGATARSSHPSTRRHPLSFATSLQQSCTHSPSLLLPGAPTARYWGPRAPGFPAAPTGAWLAHRAWLARSARGAPTGAWLAPRCLARPTVPGSPHGAWLAPRSGSPHGAGSPYGAGSPTVRLAPRFRLAPRCPPGTHRCLARPQARSPAGHPPVPGLDHRPPGAVSHQGALLACMVFQPPRAARQAIESHRPLRAGARKEFRAAGSI